LCIRTPEKSAPKDDSIWLRICFGKMLPGPFEEDKLLSIDKIEVVAGPF
jgi:hypothetical protein